MTTALSIPARDPRSAIVDCPVCPRTGLTAGTSHCPNCGVDLQPLWRVRALEHWQRAQAGNAPAGAASGARPRGALRRRRVLVAALLLALAGAAGALQRLAPPASAAAREPEPVAAFRAIACDRGEP